MPTITTDEDRDRLARALLRLLARALPDGASVELRLAAEGGEGDATRGRTQIVLGGPDAVSRLLWPPTPTSLAEAFLRGDLDIDGDIDAALEAGERLALGRLRWADRRRLLRGMLRLRAGAAPAPALHRVSHPCRVPATRRRGTRRGALPLRSFVSARLTPAAYAHGLALAMPEKVAMARPTV